MSLARVTALRRQDVVTGIDFVRVHSADQRTLRLYFLVELEPTLAVSAESVRIRNGSGAATVPVVDARMLQVEGRMVLELDTAFAGDFATYELTVESPRVDPLLGRIKFNFKQGCPSRLDCGPVEAECPPHEDLEPRVDYRARDFASLNRALLDFSADRYPDWSERTQADVGVMLMEVMSSLGDEFAYIQDRYAREAYLSTATQRRSLRGHTRLVDYTIHDGNTAHTALAATVTGDDGMWLDFGQRVWAPPVGDSDTPVPFTLGYGLASGEGDSERRVWLHPAWNELGAFTADGARPCLQPGATQLLIRGTYPTAEQLPDGVGSVAERVARAWRGRDLVLRTEPSDPSIPLRQHRVTVTGVEHGIDAIMVDGAGAPVRYTRLTWSDSEALRVPMALEDIRVHANVVPATAGETVTEHVHIGETSAAMQQALAALGTTSERAIERVGAAPGVRPAMPIIRYTLKRTPESGLSWSRDRRGRSVPPDAADPLGLRDSRPDVVVTQLDAEDPAVEIETWRWRRSALDAAPFEPAYSLEDGAWTQVIAFRHKGKTVEHSDYSAGAGFTIRFGDGEFGRIPPRGSVFRVVYRTGPGRAANLARQSVTLLEHPHTGERDLPQRIAGVTNPLAIDSGVDAEESASAARLAPDAFRAVTHRAVTAGDYRAMAERLPWVQRAGARFRWTGSWTSAFATADPAGASTLTDANRGDLERQLERVRQAGREVLVQSPRFVDLDLQIEFCVDDSAYPGQVEVRVMEALVTRGNAHRREAFFHPDRFSFGDGLSRSALEAAVHAVPGVKGVLSIRLRARGRFDWRSFHETADEMVLAVGPREVIRVEHDPAFPDRGTLELFGRASSSPDRQLARYTGEEQP